MGRLPGVKQDGLKKIMVIDDSTLILKIVGQTIEELGHKAILASSAEEAFAILECEKPDIILLDVIMPNMNGFEMCRILQEQIDTCDIPIIFITATNSSDDIVRGFETGAVDYITKPFSTPELRARLNNQLQLQSYRSELEIYVDLLRQTNNELQTSNQKLRCAMEQAESLARQDFLTGLYNRRYISERLEEEVNRAHRNMKPFGISICDIDDFKKVNDNYGHQCGDLALQIISGILGTNIRSQDMIGRWGGEEFILVFPDTNIDGVRTIATKLKNMIEKTPVQFGEQCIKLTMTFGITCYTGDRPLEKEINAADKALLEGKNHGKNCVVCARRFRNPFNPDKSRSVSGY